MSVGRDKNSMQSIQPKMQGHRIGDADANTGSANDLEWEQDDAVVESDEFKDDEFDASNKGYKYALQSTDSGCSKGRLSPDYRQIANANVQ